MKTPVIGVRCKKGFSSYQDQLPNSEWTLTVNGRFVIEMLPTCYNPPRQSGGHQKISYNVTFPAAALKYNRLTEVIFVKHEARI